MSQWWSWALTAVGVFGLWLAGRKDRRGWLVGLGAQLLWLGYALATSQYGFVVSALTYGAVYVHNARAWKPQSDIVTCQPTTTKEHPVQITIEITDITQKTNTPSGNPRWVLWAETGSWHTAPDAAVSLTITPDLIGQHARLTMNSKGEIIGLERQQ